MPTRAHQIILDLCQRNVLDPMPSFQMPPALRWWPLVWAQLQMLPPTSLAPTIETRLVTGQHTHSLSSPRTWSRRLLLSIVLYLMAMSRRWLSGIFNEIQIVSNRSWWLKPSLWPRKSQHNTHKQYNDYQHHATTLAYFCLILIFTFWLATPTPYTYMKGQAGSTFVKISTVA